VAGIADAFKKLFNFDFKGFSKSLSEAFKSAGNDMANIIKAPMNKFIDVLNALKIPKVDISGSVLGKGFSFTLIPDTDLIPGDIPGFANGGLIPEYAGGGSIFPTRGTDRVPILGTPGEFVVNRKATQNNRGLLSSINAGEKVSTGITIDKIEINAKTNLDADSIRREVIPAIEKHLKRVSKDGQYIIAATGVR
jgi:hypothetical protein